MLTNTSHIGCVECIYILVCVYVGRQRFALCTNETFTTINLNTYIYILYTCDIKSKDEWSEQEGKKEEKN